MHITNVIHLSIGEKDSQSISCRSLLSLFSFTLYRCFRLTQQLYQKHEYEFIIAIAIESGESLQNKLILKQILNA